MEGVAPPVGGEAGQVATLPARHEGFSRTARGSVVAAGQHEGGLRSPGGVEETHQQPLPPLAHLALLLAANTSICSQDTNCG